MRRTRSRSSPWAAAEAQSKAIATSSPVSGRRLRTSGSPWLISTACGSKALLKATAAWSCNRVTFRARLVVCGAVAVYALAPNVERGLQTPLYAASTSLPLIEAVKAGDRARVRTLVKQRAELTRAEADGTTALHWAVRADDIELVRMLLTAGADVSAATREGITPLALAAINGSVGMTETLLKAGAKPNVALPEGETIVMTAARTGQPEVIKLLLKAGADLNAQENWFGETAL